MFFEFFEGQCLKIWKLLKRSYAEEFSTRKERFCNRVIIINGEFRIYFLEKGVKKLFIFKHNSICKIDRRKICIKVYIIKKMLKIKFVFNIMIIGRKFILLILKFLHKKRTLLYIILEDFIDAWEVILNIIFLLIGLFVYLLFYWMYFTIDLGEDIILPFKDYFLILLLAAFI